jgi:hypothetical protein
MQFCLISKNTKALGPNKVGLLTKTLVINRKYNSKNVSA